jgi:hypothetical protein
MILLQAFHVILLEKALSSDGVCAAFFVMLKYDHVRG